MSVSPLTQSELLSSVVVGSQVQLVHAKTGTIISGTVTEVTTRESGIAHIRVAGIGTSLDTQNRWKDGDFFVVDNIL